MLPLTANKQPSVFRIYLYFSQGDVLNLNYLFKMAEVCVSLKLWGLIIFRVSLGSPAITFSLMNFVSICLWTANVSQAMVLLFLNPLLKSLSIRARWCLIRTKNSLFVDCNLVILGGGKKMLLGLKELPKTVNTNACEKLLIFAVQIIGWHWCCRISFCSTVWTEQQLWTVVFTGCQHQT